VRILEIWDLPLRTQRAVGTYIKTLPEAEGPRFYAKLQAALRMGDFPRVGYRDISVPLGTEKSQTQAILTDPSSPMFVWRLPSGTVMTMNSSAETHGEWWRAVRLPEAHDHRIRRPATDVSSGSR